MSLTTGRVQAFTTSFGLASSEDAATFPQVVAVADRALFEAKAAGRNRVVVAGTTKVVDDLPSAQTNHALRGPPGP